MTQFPDKCTDCGLCCFMAVLLETGVDDRRQIPEDMIRRFARPDKYYGMLLHKDSDECIAWDRETKLCAIYENRPECCRSVERCSGVCKIAIEDNLFRGI